MPTPMKALNDCLVWYAALGMFAGILTVAWFGFDRNLEVFERLLGPMLRPTWLSVWSFHFYAVIVFKMAEQAIRQKRSC